MPNGQQPPRANSPPERDWEADWVPLDYGETEVRTHRVISLEPFPLLPQLTMIPTALWSRAAHSELPAALPGRVLREHFTLARVYKGRRERILDLYWAMPSAHKSVSWQKQAVPS